MNGRARSGSTSNFRSIGGVFFREVYPSVLPAYHMNKEHWSSVILDGSIPDGEIERMTQMSFDLTMPQVGARRTQKGGA